MTSKLHVLFLCGWYPSRVLTNNGDFIQRHAEAVSTLHKVSVIHMITDQNCKIPIEYSSKKIRNVHTYIAYVKVTKNPILKLYRFIKAYKHLMSIVGAFDLVHLNKTYPFGILTFFIRKPLLISEHWTGYHSPKAYNLSLIERFLTRLIIKRAKFVCPVSNDLKKSMEDIRFSGNYYRIPNVVDTAKFYPLQCKTNDVFTILHISNMNDDHKNVSGIIEAVSRLQITFKLILLGSNSKKFIPIAKRYNVFKATEFIEHVPHDTVSDYLNKSDVLVLFSRYENLPCVILESFSCGTPVVSTDVGGIHEFFPDNFGFLIQKEDTNSLASCILKTSRVPNLLKTQMHQYVQDNFSITHIANEFTHLYKKMLL